MPISPQDVKLVKQIPQVVFDVVDELIVKHWNGRYAVVPQNEITTLLEQRTNKKAQHFYDNRYLDIEDSYREVGWEVLYEGQGYCETNPPMFKFYTNKVKK